MLPVCEGIDYFEYVYTIIPGFACECKSVIDQPQPPNVMSRGSRRFPSFTCVISGKRITAIRQTVFVVLNGERYPVSWAAYISLTSSGVYKEINTGNVYPEGVCLVQNERHESIGYFFAKELMTLDVDWNRGFKEHFPEEPPW